MTDSEKKSFIMYKSFRTMLLRMSMEERGKMITAIYEYVYDGKVSVELDAVVDMAFCAVKDTLDRDMESYAEKCRINSENGKKGGRPRKGVEKNESRYEGDFSSSKTERFFQKAKKADNDNDNDNGNDNDNDNVNGNGEDNGNGNDNECSSEHRSLSELPHPTEGEKTRSEKIRLTDGEMSELAAEGVPRYYIDERLERAGYFSERQKKPVSEVLRQWWRSDSGRDGGSRASPTIPLSRLPEVERSACKSSFDIDDFFASAMERSALNAASATDRDG